jgi:UDP-N-acetylglucosamine 2-epimerase (non-hydrolysing)
VTVSVHLIAAARPNFMKVAPLFHALRAESWSRPVLIHTGQHYDSNMSDTFFDDLGLPKPDHHLGIGSGTHAEQTAAVMTAYERLCATDRPDWIVVVGDVNSTMACALVGAKLCLPVAHLEAGLRSRDKTMPEEINRIVTDGISDLLWTPSPDADDNLRAEGVPQDRIVRVGNIMIDSFELLRKRIEKQDTVDKYGLTPNQYGVVTLHRPANVDDPAKLRAIVRQLSAVSSTLPLVFSIHPRTRQSLEKFDLLGALQAAPGLTLAEPMSYIVFLSLVRQAMLIITDSGGIQEETTYLGIPCITLRNTTERPITVTLGTNRLVRPDRLHDAVSRVAAGRWPKSVCPPLWDGRTAARVVESLKCQIQV